MAGYSQQQQPAPPSQGPPPPSSSSSANQPWPSAASTPAPDHASPAGPSSASTTATTPAYGSGAGYAPPQAPGSYEAFDPSLVPAYQLPPAPAQAYGAGQDHPAQQQQQHQQHQQAYGQQQQAYPHPQQYGHPAYAHQPYPPQQQQQQQQMQHQHHHHQQQQQQHQLSSANALLGLKRQHPSSGSSTPNPHAAPAFPSNGNGNGGGGGQPPAGKKQRRQSSTSRAGAQGAGGSSDEDDSDDDSDEEDDEDESDDDAAGASAKGGKPKLAGKGKDTKPLAGAASAAGAAAGGATGKGKAVELGPDGKKPKATRGSRACTVCRKLKMRCFSEDGPPCKRCKSTNQECIFEESNRGKKSTKKHEAMAQSLRKMEQTLDTVLRSIHNPALAAFASGMVTRSPSPSGGAGTAAAAGGRLSVGPGAGGHHPGFAGELSGHHLHQHPHPHQLHQGHHALGLGVNGSPAGSNGSGSGAGRPPQAFYPPPPPPGPPLVPLGPPYGLHHPQPAALAAHPHSSSSSSTSGPHHAHQGPPPPGGLTAPPSRAHSPRLHSLPDNSLNPLGLLAEASLHNHRRVGARAAASGGGPTHKAGLLVRNLLNGEPAADGAAAAPSEGEGAGGGQARTQTADEEALTDATIAKVNRVLGRPTVGHGGSSDLRSRPPSPAAADGAPSASGGASDASASSGGSGGAVAGAKEATPAAANGKGKGKQAAAKDQAVKAEPPAEDDVPLGLASTVYFKPGPMTMLPLRRIIIERSIRPEILDFLSTDEVLELFTIYFDFINVQIPVLDRAFHTPGLVASRSPFLLTTVCWVASKFYSKRPELVGRLNTCVRKLAFETPGHGFKSVEIVQAYLILTSYGLPVERFELDQAWLLLGMGIRVATDLNLHRKSQLSGKDSEEAKARDREIINRERTWLMCFVLDRSLSSQMGKPSSIREDFIIRNKSTWAASSSFATFTDRGLVAYVGLQQIMSRALDFIYSGTSTASGLQTDLDYPLFLRSVEAQLSIWDTEWHEAWDRLYQEASEEVKPQLGHSRSVGSFYCSYALLMMNSFGLQNALEKAHIELGHFFARVAGAALEVIKIARDDLAPTGKLTYAPDSTFTMLSYAILSLLKLLRPALTIYIDSPAKILEAVHGAVKVLEDVAINAHHTPALHAQLLRSLLSSTESRPNSVPGTPYPAQTRQHSPAPADAAAAAAAGTSDPTLAPTANGAMSVPGGTSPVFTDWAAAFGGSFPEGDDFAAAGYATFGTADAAWGNDPALNGAEGGLNLEAIWPANSGIFDSHLLPGWNSSMELAGGTVSFGNGGSFTPQVTSPTQSHARRMTGE